MPEENHKGFLGLEHFDQAIFHTLECQRLPIPNPDDHSLLNQYHQQAYIPNVEGSGGRFNDDENNRVIAVFHFPDHVYNRYILPGIRVQRGTSISYDDQRRTPPNVGYKYRVPSNNGKRLTVGDESGSTRYVQRAHAEPIMLNYDIEVRAKREIVAQRMFRYVRKRLKDKQPIEVEDSQGDISHFMAFRDDMQDIEQLLDSLNRYNGYLIKYRVRAELDDYEEYETQAVTGTPDIGNEQTTEE